MSDRARWWRALDAALVIAAVGGAVLLALPGRADMGPPTPRVPSATLHESAGGAKVASIDAEAWREVHLAALLPAPGEIQGVDPVPVEVLRGAIKRWIELRDADAIGVAGEVYLALESHDAAIRFFAAASALNPASPRWRYLLGAELQTVGMVEPALSALKQARDLEPNYATTHARIGELYLEQGDLRLAAESFVACRALQPNVSLGYVGLGRVALAERRFSEARQQLERAVEVTPNDFRAWRMLSRAYAGLGDEAQALDAARQADRLPEYRGWLTFDVWLAEAQARADTQTYLENRIRAALQVGQANEAIELLQQLSERRPNDADVLVQLAQQHLSRGELADAKRYSERALALDSGDASNHALKAMIHLVADEYGPAHAALDEAMRLDSAYAPAWDLRGRALLLEQKPAEAAAALERAVALDGGVVGSRYMLAYALAQLGRRDEAIAQLERVLEMEPGHASAQRLLESLRQ